MDGVLNQLVLTLLDTDYLNNLVYVGGKDIWAGHVYYLCIDIQGAAVKRELNRHESGLDGHVANQFIGNKVQALVKCEAWGAADICLNKLGDYYSRLPAYSCVDFGIFYPWPAMVNTHVDPDGIAYLDGKFLPGGYPDSHGGTSHARIMPNDLY
ncbi:hypothetical protein ES703_89559 [subsurface metagenome]